MSAFNRELFEWIQKEDNREMVRMVLDEIERRAERRMLQTHKLEGMHYSAILDVRRELKVERNDVNTRKGIAWARAEQMPEVKP